MWRGTGESFSDRLNCRYTCAIIIITALLSFYKAFSSDAVTCWSPSQFNAAQQDYANRVCGNTDSFYLPLRPPPSSPEEDMQEREPYHSSHKSLPLLLAFQALLFFLPGLLWRVAGSRGGLEVAHVVLSCQQAGEHKSLQAVVDRLHACLQRGAASKRSLVLLYLTCKFLYLINTLFQLFLLTTPSSMLIYGTSILSGPHPFHVSQAPSIVLCDFAVSILGRIHQHTVQCSMGINAFNNTARNFLKLWLLFVAACSVCSFCRWCFFLLLRKPQERFVEERLAVGEWGGSKEGEGVKEWQKRHLGSDGCLMLRLVALNCGDVVASKLLCGLWQRHAPEAPKLP